MNAIIDREETIQKEEVKDNTIAVTVQCEWRILEDKDNEIEFMLSASPSLMKIVKFMAEWNTHRDLQWNKLWTKSERREK